VRDCLAQLPEANISLTFIDFTWKWSKAELKLSMQNWPIHAIGDQSIDRSQSQAIANKITSCKGQIRVDEWTT